MVLTEMSSEQANSVFRYYGVVPATDLAVLKTQFRDLAQKHHPDRGGSTESMQEINAAYQMLVVTTKSRDTEEIRRKPGAAFEDFSDVEYFQRRVKSISPNAQACVAYAFNGESFTAEVSLEADLNNEEALVMVREGMLTHGGSYHTQIIGVALKSDPRKFYVIFQAKNRGAQRVSYVPMGGGFTIDVKRDSKLIDNLKSLVK